jgi:hypothetical protein
MVGEFKLDAGVVLGWKFLPALFRCFPTVPHETYALYDAPLLLLWRRED